jgi:pimeloyl-ACP methyl ester carboxylesterase
VTDAVPLVFLPGALGELEGSDSAADRLGESRPLVRIDYGPDDTAEGLLARVAAAAGSGGAERWDVIGQSYGGWIAQCLARRHPNRTRRLVLSHSFTLSRRDAVRLRLGSRLLERMPMPLMRPLLLKRVRHALAPLAQKAPDRVERQMAGLARELRRPAFRQKLAAQQRCMAESLQYALPAMRADLPVLIIDSDSDPLVHARARQALRDSYPQAVVQSFPGAGHISAMVEPTAFVKAVRDFLDR